MPSSLLSSYTVCKDSRAEGDGEVSLQICLIGAVEACSHSTAPCVRDFIVDGAVIVYNCSILLQSYRMTIV